MKQFSDYNELSQNIQSNGHVLLYFSAPWCAPCNVMGPVMDDIGKDFGNILTTIKVDVEKVPELAGEYGVQAVPTVLLLNKGDVVDKAVGAQPKAHLSRWLSDHLLVY